MVFLDTGKALRLSRIINPRTGKAALVALDHGLHLGATPGLENAPALMKTLAENGADAFLLSLGLLRDYRPVAEALGRNAPAVIARIDWANMWRGPNELGFPEGRTRLIASVEDALRYGADAVLVYYFMGLDNPDAEADLVMQVAKVARDCERLGMPCFIEPMARGTRVGKDIYSPDYVRIHVRQALELGADAIKTDYTGDSASFKAAIAGVDRPVFIAGGPKAGSTRQALEMVVGAMTAGASGIFFGRNIFQEANPARMMRASALLIHEGISVEEALKILE
jgi:DhnA family fructose-bisphosphate aldolase class Ia